MINLEQVKLLETKVARAIDYIERLTGENTELRSSEAELRIKESELQGKLESCQKRNNELEVLIMRFKEDQSRIEDSILAALDRLNQFEDALESSLADKPGGKAAGMAAGTKAAAQPAKAEPAEEEEAVLVEEVEHVDLTGSSLGDANICFEIPETENGDDILDPLTDTFDEEPRAKGGELDIF
jgi:FtsZ-binding cell division protein ZapB